MTDIPRSKYLGRRLETQPEDEAEHFIKCEACGGWIDCRDLAYSSAKARCHIRRRISHSRPGRDYGLSGTACGAGSGDDSRRISSIMFFLIAAITISVSS
jgi:hypothetical protein